MVEQPQESVLWLHERAAEWTKDNPDSDVIRVWTIIHEGVHLQYAREAGFLDPEVYGPHEKKVYRYGEWRQEQILGAVETLPPGTKLFADRIQVGKFFLGPRCVEEYLRGRSDDEKVWNGSLGDLESFNKWFEERQRLRDDLYEGLKSDIYRAVRADYRDPIFHRRIWECACEYESRVSEQAKHGEASTNGRELNGRKR